MTNPLHDLAGRLGVDAEVWSWQGEHSAVPESTLRAVLGALGVDASDDDAVRRALDSRDHDRPLPVYVVAREGDDTSVPVGGGEVALETEDGGIVPLAVVDGRATLPTDLPVGYHRLVSDGAACTVIRPPRRLSLPDGLDREPGWGFAAQLYSVRSRRSWGIGDLGDLTTLATWSARDHGADFVLVNPLHAAAVHHPLEPSPYLPTTRSFANPLYLRVEDVPGYDALREQVDALAAPTREPAPDGLLDRDTAWDAKRQALQLLFELPSDRASFDAYRDREGRPLQDFATWCALDETYGEPDAWPAELRRPDSREVAAFADEHAERVTFFAWLQWLLDGQLTATQRAAREAGMRVGIVHDVAVGVSPTGADAWARRADLATSVTVGAPPDAYSQTGQDWDQPPWRPDRLAELAYAPFRELFATALRHSGGLRVDHVIGLFRLWWIPRGRPAREGTYVHYDHDALTGILMIEAQRAGAVIIGEDLGNVEPWVRDYLRERGVLGTSILWFEYDGDGRPLPPERWRELCLASVTTHDLPPTAGYLAGDHVRLRDQLGLLTVPVADELARDAAERERWLGVLRGAGLLPDGDVGTEQIVTALHRALHRAPSVLRCAALVDAVGDRRIQNQPGTTQAQHPNWRVPLSGPDGEPMLLEDVVDDPRVARLARVMRERQ
ncbi:4-alpha-glucanotransferase [Jatrophihabitans fulvus]